MHLFIALFILLIALSERSLGKEKTPPLWRRHLQTGDCRLSPSGEEFKGWEKYLPSLCLRPQAGAEVAIATRPEAPDNFWATYLKGHSSLHIGRDFSIHGKGRIWRMRALSESAKPRSEVTAEELVARIGNPGTSRLRLIAGRMRLPFGIGFSPVMESFREVKTDKYWLSPRFGSQISIDNLADAQLDLGAATDEWPPKKVKDLKNANEQRNEALSMRYMLDLPALSGTRLFFSAYGDLPGQRRVGFGTLNYNPKGEMTLFEWIKLRDTPSGKSSPDKTLLRLAYRGIFRNEGRWIAEYDDESEDHRLGSVGHDFRFGKPAHSDPGEGEWLMMRFAVAYFKSEKPQVHSHWLFLMGGDVQL